MVKSEKEDQIRSSSARLASLLNVSEKSAETTNLVYITDKTKGITRVKKGEKFFYFSGDKIISDEEILSRIRALVIPPAWKEVWICSSPNGHIQAIGLDNNGRKQYRYHPLWNTMRSETKYSQLYDFGKALPEMRKHINADLARSELSQEKVLAAIVSLMQYTGIRVGNNMYEKLYGSFGLSTLKDKHVRINGSEIRFSFKGKKGVYQDITLKSRKLSKIVKQCRDIPGKELFQYYDGNGERKTVDSGMVNAYIKEISGGNFTSKDFRTWTGSISALKAFISLGYDDSITATKRKINEALDMAAKQLGNTRNVCRKYYIHPVVIEHYLNKTIQQYFNKVSPPEDETGLTIEEQILMRMLADVHNT